MGVLYKKGCNIVIKVFSTYMKIMSCTVPIMDTDGFTVHDYRAGRTVITLAINWIHSQLMLYIINYFSWLNLYTQKCFM